MAKKEKKQQEATKTGKIVNTVINILLIVCIVLAFVCTYTSYVTKMGSGVPSLFGRAPLAIQSDSMAPTFEEGDLIITKIIDDAGDLEVGEVITFWTIINGERVLNTHRITQVMDGGSYTYYVTKGDNNNMEDAMTVHESEVVGVYQKSIPNLGTVLDFLQTSKGFFIIVVLPVAFFFVYYLIGFFRALFAYQAEKNKEKYREEIEAENKQAGTTTLTEEQITQMLAKAILEASKQNAAAEKDTEK